MNDSMMVKKLNEILKFVYSYLIKMGASKEDAEDIIQDTAYKFLQYIDSVQLNNIQSWLFRVAVNQYYDMSRKKSRRRDILLKFNLQEIFEEEINSIYGEKISKVEYLEGDLYTAYVVKDGKEVPYVTVNARTGYFHG